nr:hypothetical protein [Marinobacterium jannaschii]
MLSLLLLSLGGCSAAKSYQYHSDREIPEGPGLISGQHGSFKLRPISLGE